MIEFVIFFFSLHSVLASETDCAVALNLHCTSDAFSTLYEEYGNATNTCIAEENCPFSDVQVEGGNLRTVQGIENPRNFDVNTAAQKLRQLCFEDFGLDATMCGMNGKSSIKEILPNDTSTELVGFHVLCYPNICSSIVKPPSFRSFARVFSSERYKEVIITADCSDGTKLHLELLNPEFREDPLKPEEPEVDIVTKTSSNTGAIAGSVVGAVVLLALVIAFFVYRKRKQKGPQLDQVNEYVDLPTPVPQQYTKDLYSTLSTGSMLNTGASSASLAISGIEANHYLNPEKLEIGDVLGQGTFGAVYRGEYLGTAVAIKVLFRQTPESIGEFEKEVGLLKNLHHPNIVQFFGIACKQNYGLCVLTEFMAKGDLTTVPEKVFQGEMDLKWTGTGFSKTKILINVTSGLSYLHGLENPIVHRDLKSQNILLSEHFVAKIADFGVSRTKSVSETMTAAGSAFWQSPEIIRGEQYDEKADIYSLGVVMVEIETNQIPFADAYSDDFDANGNKIKLNANAITYRVSQKGLRPSFSPDCLHRVQELGRQCMAENPQDRPTAMEVLKIVRGWEQ